MDRFCLLLQLLLRGPSVLLYTSHLLLRKNLGPLDDSLWGARRPGKPRCCAPGGRVFGQHHDLLLTLVDPILWGDCQQDWTIGGAG